MGVSAYQVCRRDKFGFILRLKGGHRADLTVEVAGRKQSVDVVLGEPGLPTFKRRGVAVPFPSPDDKLGGSTRVQEGVTVLDHFVQL